MKQTDLVSYHFAILRVVPHVHLGPFVNIGVVLHARTAEYLGIRRIIDPVHLRERVQDVDLEILHRYLDCYDGICNGDPLSGPLSRLPRSERFHWLTAPRSDVLQMSAIHEGLSADPGRALQELFEQFVIGVRAVGA